MYKANTYCVFFSSFSFVCISALLTLYLSLFYGQFVLDVKSWPISTGIWIRRFSFFPVFSSFSVHHAHKTSILIYLAPLLPAESRISLSVPDKNAFGEDGQFFFILVHELIRLLITKIRNIQGCFEKFRVWSKRGAKKLEGKFFVFPFSIFL